MTGDATVIANLQAGTAMLARLAEQYRVDARQLHALDLDWLSARVSHWHDKLAKHLGIFIDALLYLGSDPAYSIPEISKAGSVAELLERDKAIATAAFLQFCAFRKESWDTQADDIPDLYEHAIQALKHQVVKIERELNLIVDLGEPEYIAARLEDGGK